MANINAEPLLTICSRILGITDFVFHAKKPRITPEYIIDLGEIMTPDSTLGYIFLFLAVVIVAPIGEEIVFRGFLQRFLEKYWKDITRAVLVTSLFFAMIHFNPFWTIQIYLLGVILGFVAWKTKSVIPYKAPRIIPTFISFNINFISPPIFTLPVAIPLTMIVDD